MIRIQPVPADDGRFRELVRFALDAAGAADRSHLVADDLPMLERALVTIRRDCPGATIRQRHPIAAIDPTEETWYVFREDATPA